MLSVRKCVAAYPSVCVQHQPVIVCHAYYLRCNQFRIYVVKCTKAEKFFIDGVHARTSTSAPCVPSFTCESTVRVLTPVPRERQAPRAQTTSANRAPPRCFPLLVS